MATIIRVFFVITAFLFCMSPASAQERPGRYWKPGEITGLIQSAPPCEDCERVVVYEDDGETVENVIVVRPENMDEVMGFMKKAKPGRTFETLPKDRAAREARGPTEPGGKRMPDGKFQKGPLSPEKAARNAARDAREAEAAAAAEALEAAEAAKQKRVNDMQAEIEALKAEIQKGNPNR